MPKVRPEDRRGGGKPGHLFGHQDLIRSGDPRNG